MARKLLSALSDDLGLGLQVPVGSLVLRQDVGGDHTGLLGNADSEGQARSGNILLRFYSN